MDQRFDKAGGARLIPLPFAESEGEGRGGALLQLFPFFPRNKPSKIESTPIRTPLALCARGGVKTVRNYFFNRAIIACSAACVSAEYQSSMKRSSRMFSG